MQVLTLGITKMPSWKVSTPSSLASISKPAVTSPKLQRTGDIAEFTAEAQTDCCSC